MAPSRLRYPDAIQALLETRYRRQRGAWFLGDGVWPIRISLGLPKAEEASRNLAATTQWAKTWQDWQGVGELVWVTRRWPALGSQRLPATITFESPLAVMAYLGKRDEWERGMIRRDRWCARWPMVRPALAVHVAWLMDAPEEDVLRMEALIAWLLAHPHSALYPRQVPVAGLDTKWMSGQMKRIADFMTALGVAQGAEGYGGRWGLKAAPARLRMRVLDSALRQVLGGLEDVQVPTTEAARISWRPRRVIIVENLQTGLAFGDWAGTVLIMGLGYGVECLGQLPWVQSAGCCYWGDIDTHGFAILDRVRGYVPHVASVLMDEVTLIRHRSLWVSEARQHGAVQLKRLEGPEQALYGRLKSQELGTNVRLEQERIDWAYAWSQLHG